MIPLDKVRDIINKHNTLEKELSSGNIDPKLFAKKSKDYSNLGEIIKIAREYINFENEKKDLINLIEDKSNDKEIVELAEKDLNDLIKRKEKYENDLKVFLLPKDEDDNKNAIVEIRAGTGGLEASLFCADLFKMYEKVCSKKKWKLELINISKSEAGGYKEVIFLVNGEELGDRKAPKSWEDLLDPIYEKSVSLPVSDFDLFNAILLNIHKKYGDEGVQALGRSLLESMHPAEMVRSEQRKVNKPAITIMPYFFSKMVKEGGPLQAIWPEDGSILSPIS